MSYIYPKLLKILSFQKQTFSPFKFPFYLWATQLFKGFWIKLTQGNITSTEAWPRHAAGLATAAVQGGIQTQVGPWAVEAWTLWASLLYLGPNESPLRDRKIPDSNLTKIFKIGYQGPCVAAYISVHQSVKSRLQFQSGNWAYN